MAEIMKVQLVANNEAGLRFHYRGNALPDGSSVLKVTDGSKWWNFKCTSEEGNMFSISGSEWRDFVKPRVTAIVTLYSKEEGEDSYRIKVRQSLTNALMEGETSNGEIKVEAAVEVEPISVQRCCSLVPDQSTERICRYKECRRNHAASFGRYAFDGCGEFICCNDDVFMCAACGCHRSFHRKDPPNNYNNVTAQPLPQPMPPQRPLVAPLPLASHNGLTGETFLFNRDRNIDAGSETLSEAEIEEEKNTKKRAKRTKLTMEQKTKMMRFADKLGWRTQRHDDAEVQQFCEELGITKPVFIVWLNNNRRRKDSM